MAIVMNPGVGIVRCYDNSTEIFMLNFNGTVVHKRPNLRFIRNYSSNDNTVAYQQRRTYEVENPVNPGSISRPGYTFKGWGMTRDSTIPIPFPWLVPFTQESEDFVDYGYAIWEEATQATTATPTVGTPSCRNNQLRVSVKNNDSMTVEIYNGGISYMGTLDPGVTQTLTLYPALKMPVNYNISITAIAPTKQTSIAVSRTGTVDLCPLT